MNKASDIQMEHWVYRLLPGWFRPYALLARWDRPIGTWLLLFPAWWGLALASPGLPPLDKMALFAIGAFVMRGAGCTINDMIDRDMDRLVARTANRPLASGRLSMRQAFIFLIIQTLIGLAILASFGSVEMILLAALSLGLIALYPFMKRITYWPQAFLGLTFNWGALLGWVAEKEGLSSPPLLLYAGGIFWTLHYDTIYAHQDKQDDAMVGIRSTARLLGAKTKYFLALFSGAAILLWGLSFWQAALPPIAYLGLCLAGLHLIYQIVKTNIDDPHSCLRIFKSNQIIGWIILCSILSARWWG